MFSKTSRRPLRAALLSVSLLIAAAGCASDASDDTASGPEPTEANAATTTTVPCEGAPIKLMQIASLEGGVSWPQARSEEHTSELQSLMRISYAVFCLKKKTKHNDRATKETIHTTVYNEKHLI